MEAVDDVPIGNGGEQASDLGRRVHQPDDSSRVLSPDIEAHAEDSRLLKGDRAVDKREQNDRQQLLPGDHDRDS